MIDLLDRLESVKETGPGRWLCRCPGPLHENGDRHPSLGIRRDDDGTWLLRCYAGCETADVLAALGLRFADLFPDGGPRGNRYERGEPKIPARDALAAIDHEAHVVWLIAHDFIEKRDIDEDAFDRLSLAVSRIGQCRAIVAPAKRTAA